MSKNSCDSCCRRDDWRMSCACAVMQGLTEAFGTTLSKCNGYKPMPKPPEVVRVVTVEITQIGHNELGADSLRMKCVEAEMRNRLRNAFPEADNINIARVQEFVLDGE